MMRFPAAAGALLAILVASSPARAAGAVDHDDAGLGLPVLRGLEHVRRLGDPRWRHHGVMKIALSPDGERLATGSADGTVILWQTRTGRQLDGLATGVGNVWVLRFIAGGAELVVGGNDAGAYRVQRWRLRGDRFDRAPQVAPLSAPATDVRPSTDGRRLILDTHGGPLVVDLANGWPATLVAHGWSPPPGPLPWQGAYTRVRAFSFLPDGRRVLASLLTGGQQVVEGAYVEIENQTIGLAFYDLDSRTIVGRIAPDGGRIGAFASGDGKRLLVTGERSVTWWDLSSYKKIAERPVPEMFSNPTLSPDGSRFVVRVAGDNRPLGCFAMGATGTEWSVPLGGPEQRRSFDHLQFSDDGRRVLIAGCPTDRCEARLLDASSGKPVLAPFPTGDPESVALDRQAATVASIQGYRGLAVAWPAAPSQRVAVPDGYAVDAIVQDGDHDVLAWRAGGGIAALGALGVNMLLPANDRCVTATSIGAAPGEIGAVVQDRCSGGRTVRIWRSLDLAPARSFAVEGGELLSQAFTADGRWALLQDEHGHVHAHDLRGGRTSGSLWGWSRTGRGKQADSITDHTVGLAAFTRDGRWAYDTGPDFALVQRSRSDGRLARLLTHHRSFITAIALSRSERWIASGADDGRVVLMNLADTGRRRVLLPAGAGAVSGIAFSPDDRRIAIAQGTTVRIVDVASGTAVSQADWATVPDRVAALSFTGDAVVVGTARGILHLMRLVP
jgi:WD40 repeat protein